MGYTNEYLTAIHELLNQHFNLEELQTLCFNLGVDHESLGGSEKPVKARELVLYLNRRNQIAQLESAVRSTRPEIPWPQPAVAVLSDSAAADSVTTSGSQSSGAAKQVGGIRANRIEADNVVQGMQQIGGDLSDAANAVALAEALSGGTISADSIEAQNVVAGFQYIADPAQATQEELRLEVARLREQLAEAVAAGEVEAGADVEDAQEALGKAEAELAKDQPQGNRVMRKLKEAAGILTEGAKMTDAARQAGTALLKLAPVAAALAQIASQMFGG